MARYLSSDNGCHYKKGISLTTHLLLGCAFLSLFGCSSHPLIPNVKQNNPEQNQARIRFVSDDMATLYQVPYGQCGKRVALASLSNMFSPRTHWASSVGMPWLDSSPRPHFGYRYKEVVVEGDKPIQFVFGMKKEGKHCHVNKVFTPRIGQDYEITLDCDLSDATRLVHEVNQPLTPERVPLANPMLECEC